MVNQIKGGASVTEATGAKLAGPLGFSDFAELVVAAYNWRYGGGAEGEETPLSEAVRLAGKYGITRAQVERGITRVPEERRASFDALAWLAIFHDERSLDARIDGELRAAAKMREADQRDEIRVLKEQLQAARAKQKVAPKKSRRSA